MGKKFKSVTYTELGHPGSSHYPTGEKALEANYIGRDIGSRPIDLTFSAFGYELREDEAVIMIGALSQFLDDVRAHKQYLNGFVPVRR